MQYDPTRNPMSIETTEADSSNVTNQTEADEMETIPNPERGCGTLKEGKAYLRTDVSADGTLPAFVEFDQPIVFKEDNKRSYKKFPGIQFELSVTGEGGMTTTTPEGEIHDHLDRLESDRPTGKTAGEMVEFHSNDLLMSVGATYYDTAEEFVEEAKIHGVNKAVSVTSGNQPPDVNPGRTRMFLIHPKAVEVTVETTEEVEVEKTEEVELPNGDTEIVTYTETETQEVEETEYVPGVFGYTYLSRVIYTEDADGNVPKYIQDYEATGDLDVVKPGPEIPYAEQEGFDADGNAVEDEQELLSDELYTPADVMERSKNAMDGLAEAQRDEQAKALDAPTIEKMEKADLGTLAERDESEIQGMAPPEGQDALYGDENGALAVVRVDDVMQKVMPSNNVAFDDDMERGVAATSVVGPYRLSVEDQGGARTVDVTRTR